MRTQAVRYCLICSELHCGWDHWGAAEPLVAAGLCHAAYGTDGFPVSLLDVAQRPELAAIIGRDAEAIVYAYGSLDRAHGLPGVDTPDGSTLRDRFTGRLYEPSDEDLQQLVDLTCANELDLFLCGPEAMRPHIANWLTRCCRCASPAAVATIVLHARS